MNYNILVLVSKNYWMALDVNYDGHCENISFNGNISMYVDSEESVALFCDKVLEYYNIDKFNDLDISVKTVVVSGRYDIVLKLHMQMGEVTCFNIIDIKDIIPIFVLKECNAKPGDIFTVTCLDEKFSIKIDDKYLVSYESEAVEAEVLLSPEWLSKLFIFDCSNLISDEKELLLLKKKYNEIEEKSRQEVETFQNKLLDIEEKYKELNEKYKELKRNKNLEKKLEKKRIVLSFSKNEFDKSGSIYALFEALSRKEYICRLIKSDGALVHKGDDLIEITEKCIMDSGKVYSKKKIIKADMDGRVFYLVDKDAKLSEGDGLAILTDSADKRTNAIRWYEKMKREK